MSESSTQDRTERATPKRIRDARKRGELPRSRELVSFVVVSGGVLTLMALSGTLAGAAGDWMRRALTLDPALYAAPEDMLNQFGRLAAGGFALIVPMLAVGFIAGLVAPILLGGWNISAESLKPDFKRVNPISGLKRVFSAQGLIELGKAVLKAGLLGGIAALYIAVHLGEIMALGREAIGPAMAHGIQLALACLGWMAGGLLIIAAVDTPAQLWSYARKLRMSRQEVKQEFKESEGSPEVKGRLRRLQQEVSQRRMMDAVPTADVVVVNPTHYAVALKYEAGRMRAPRVVAKGVDLLALTIRELAGRHKVPIVSAPPLARALYRNTRLDDEIPANLYAAVAQVLTYIYQLRSWRSGAPPRPPQVGEVPGGEADGP